MAIRSYCRIPTVKSGKMRSPEGACPELLHDLIAELQGAEEIHIAAYLFNNPVYYSFLASLADNGCIIKITSLPLRGYHDKKLAVEGYSDKISGRDMAEQVYRKIEDKDNISLGIFPHQYVWYGALYANGGASYSFHVKAIYAKFPFGVSKCILSSCNFMFTDPFHSDNFIVLENMPEYEKVFRHFFRSMERNSIPYRKFQDGYVDYTSEFLYSFSDLEEDLTFPEVHNCFFTAPFYNINGEGSNHYAGNRIIDLINHANDRIWICAQHFHDVLSFDRERGTIINALYQKSSSQPGIEFRFLKQVQHSSLADKRRAAISEVLFQFEMKVEQRFNRLTHDKFMIIDNTLVVSTANYTPTQFAFGKLKMKYQDEAKEKHSKLDNFSEVNGFIIIPDCPPEAINQYEKHFNTLWDSGEEIKIIL